MSAVAVAATPTEEQPTSGNGKFFYPNGSIYQGEWKFLMPEAPPVVDDKAKKKGKDEPPPPPAEPPKRVRHGKGKHIEGRFIYEGDFVEDMVTGTGKFSYPSGAFYQGQWVNGQYSGLGKYVWADGRSYEGAWVENKMHGHGIFTDASGHRWEGDFHNGSGPGLTCDLQ